MVYDDELDDFSRLSMSALVHVITEGIGMDRGNYWIITLLS